MRHRSGLKAHRQSVKRNLRNRSTKKDIRQAVRALTDGVSAKDSGKLNDLLAKASSALDKASKSGAIHWKAAARKKSRLALRAQAAAAAAK